MSLPHLVQQVAPGRNSEVHSDAQFLHQLHRLLLCWLQFQEHIDDASLQTSITLLLVQWNVLYI